MNHTILKALQAARQLELLSRLMGKDQEDFPVYQVRQYTTADPADFDQTCKDFRLLVGFETASYVGANGQLVFMVRYY